MLADNAADVEGAPVSSSTAGELSLRWTPAGDRLAGNAAAAVLVSAGKMFLGWTSCNNGDADNKADVGVAPASGSTAGELFLS